jgi:hypothetical protein
MIDSAIKIVNHSSPACADSPKMVFARGFRDASPARASTSARLLSGEFVLNQVQSPTEAGTPKHRYADQLVIRWALAQMPEVGYVIKNLCAAEMLSRSTDF